MQKIIFILLLFPFICFSQTNSIVTEYYLANNFTPLSGVTPGTNNTLAMDCDQILSRYNVSISGITTTGHRLPSQNQIIDESTSATAEMSLTLVSIPYPGVYYYTGTLTVIATQAITNGEIEFALDFLSGSVPSGQSEYRSASLEISSQFFESTGEGSMGSYIRNYSAGTTNISINLTLTNDNWNYPRPVSTFRVRLLGGDYISPLVENSTSTNETTLVDSVNGITTTFITVSTVSGGRSYSGEMIYYIFQRDPAYTYSAGNGYKSSIIQETYNTGSYSTSKLFVETFWNISTFYYNYFYTSYVHGDVYQSTYNLVYSSSFYRRFYLRNESGSLATFSYNVQPYKYCSFTEVNYSQGIYSLSPGGHILTIKSFTGDGDYVPQVLCIPGSVSLSSSDVFSYKYVFHCPTGGQISFYYAGTNHYFTDGQELSGTGTYYPTENVRFASADIATTIAKTYIGGDQVNRGSAQVYFEETDQYIEIVPTTSNIVTNSNYPYRMGYYGAY